MRDKRNANKGEPLIPTRDGRSAMPSATRPEVRRTVGKIGREDSVSITSPSPLKKGTRVVAAGAVGLRAALAKTAPSAKADEAKESARQKVDTSRSDRQKAVWDKLDAAHKKAAAKNERIVGFDKSRR